MEPAPELTAATGEKSMENSSVLWAERELQQHRTHPGSLCGKVTSSHSFWVTPLFHGPALSTEVGELKVSRKCSSRTFSGS